MTFNYKSCISYLVLAHLFTVQDLLLSLPGAVLKVLSPVQSLPDNHVLKMVCEVVIPVKRQHYISKV